MKRVQFDMEFLFKASPAIVYKFLTTPDCLIRWFCDKVDINQDIYTFTWDGADEEADLVDDFEEEYLKFRWHGADETEFLEFKMYITEVARDTVLEIHDWCDDDEVEEMKQLWSSQMERMRQEMGG